MQDEQRYEVEAYKIGKGWEAETRYRITIEGKIIDDAQGYGYKSASAAHRAWAYKHGGKERQQNKLRTARKWLKQHPEIRPLFEEIIEINYKEIGRGEITKAEIFAHLEERFGQIPEEARWALWGEL